MNLCLHKSLYIYTHTHMYIMTIYIDQQTKWTHICIDFKGVLVGYILVGYPCTLLVHHPSRVYCPILSHYDSSMLKPCTLREFVQSPSKDLIIYIRILLLLFTFEYLKVIIICPLKFCLKNKMLPIQSQISRVILCTVKKYSFSINQRKKKVFQR